MKNLFICLFISLASVSVFAANTGNSAGDTPQEIFRDKAFEVLYKNMDSVQLEGDVKPAEKLAPLFQDVADLYGYVFSSIASMGSNDDDDEKDVKLKDVVPSCGASDSAGLSRCELKLVYKSGEKADIVFHVISKNNVPVAVLGNRASLHRTPAPAAE